jgi:16S rRNA (cytidine1402-2'-O)-methyltransferase
LRHFEIGTPLISLHEHNERHRGRQLLARLQAGESIALVTDAGTPGISDPGAAFVRLAREAGIRIEPIPGPSAVTAGLSASGFGADGFVFLGFPPIRSNDRKLWFERLLTNRDLAAILFEAPHRLKKTLGDLQQYLGNRPILVARELTKAHEEWLLGSASDLERLAGEPRGEFVILIPPFESAEEAKAELGDTDIAVLFGQMTKNCRIPRREAIKTIALKAGRSQRDVYSAIERAKKSVNRPNSV